MASTWRVSAIVVLIVVLALGGAVALALANVSSTLEATVKSRFEFLSLEVRDSIETGLNLGLGLAELTNVQDIIDARANRDDAVVRIEVKTAAGETLFVTKDGAGASGTPEALGRVSAPLHNSFGQTVGTVDLVYASSSYRSAVQRIRGALLPAAAALAAITAVAAMLACTLILGGVPRRLARVHGWFADARVDDVPRSKLEHTAAQAVETSNAVIRELDEVAADLPAAQYKGHR